MKSEKQEIMADIPQDVEW